MSNVDNVKQIITYKRKEELNRKGGVSQELSIRDFGYFAGLVGNKDFSAAFEKMQKIYVLNADDILAESDVICAITQLHDYFVDIES